MKIALVWNHPSRLLDCSFRFEQYVEGFSTLGHEVVVVTSAASAAGFAGPVTTVLERSELARPALWRQLGADVAILVTWHRMVDVLEAMRGGGTRVLAIADTDGRVSLSTHPWTLLERLRVYAPGPLAQARCGKYWLGRLLRERWGRSAEDAEFLASTRASDVLFFGNQLAKENFRQLLERRGGLDLERRIAVVPFTIGDAFLRCPVAAERADRIVAIGRWDDPQKNAGLLAATLRRYLSAPGVASEVVIFGRGGERWFVPLAERFPRLRYVGVGAQEEVARTLASSRAILFSSRWEGSPHAATEALALGATVVGPPIASLRSWTEAGRYGETSTAHRPGALAAALQREMRRWQEGERDPLAIAAHWRRQVSPVDVCGALLAALDRLSDRP